ncbi:uncharacterized protein FTJAE_7237 [Fusarium tjaetaba]|uniref:Uncharacterized protein n=1 Tax=Fusarium tjaetaba TaxID=1567544 RepID=A0A8H5RCB9_9HYPO|nr:uncharacterized protein FTJAE_7237 [Fusarium tjaetaba]KAF5633205.1 hypothetical protein FTJAE_7237 [Fusarium tjaetaba]
MAPSGRQTRLTVTNGLVGLVRPSPPSPVPSVGAGAADVISDKESEQRQNAVGKTALTLGIETSVTSYRALALSVIKDCPLKRELIAFVDSETEDPQKSLVPIGDFVADKDRADWHTHCPEMMRLWKDFCTNVTDASNGQVAINEMAAPSGPKKSRATFLWHYPTKTSPNTIFSHVMDPGSPSLRVQSIKNGMRTDLKTLDLIPIRVDYKVEGPQWKETYGSRWPQIYQACLDHAKELIKDDRFIFAVGKEVFAPLKQICGSLGLTLTNLDLDVQTQMWEKKPRIYIARNSAGNIEKVIFWTFHGQFSFHNKKTNVGAVWDLLYNAGYELAGVPVLNYGYFEWKAGNLDTRGLADPKSQVGKISDRDMYNTLKDKEDAEGKSCTIELVLDCFPALIQMDPELPDKIRSAVSEKGYSPIHPILLFFQAQDRPKYLAAKRKNAAPATHAPRKRRVNAGQKRGHDTKRAKLLSKYDALLNSFEARQAEAHRFDTNKSAEYARALPRLDTIKQLRADEEWKKLSTSLSCWATFYSEEFPRGLRWSLDGGPAIVQPDPFANATQPGVRLFDATYFRDKSARLAAVGPLVEDDE